MMSKKMTRKETIEAIDQLIEFFEDLGKMLDEMEKNILLSQEKEKE